MAILTVGSSQHYTTLAAAVAATQDGDTIQVQAGTYTNDFANISRNITIEGVGGQVRLVATQSPPNGKAILDVYGNVTLKNLDFSGAAVPSGNGAGVRYEGGNLVIQNCSFHDNENGILGAADLNGTITIDRSEFYNNGRGDGQTHNIYIGDIKQFTLMNSYIHDANLGHEVKSRAEANIITNNRIFDNSSTSSYSIDLPNGGDATITGNVIEQGPNGQNNKMIAYGEEGSLHVGRNVNFSDNTIVNDLTAHTPYLFWDASGVPVTASGNTVYGLQASQLDSNNSVSSSGFTFTSTRPTLDTSSPITSPLTSPLTAKLANDTGSSSTDGITAAAGLSGNANANAAVTVKNGSTVLGTTTADAAGKWSFTPTGLADSTYTLAASQTDAAGNIGSAGVTFTLDKTAPGAPAITSQGGPTNQAAQTVAGTAEAGSMVTLLEGAQSLGTAVARADGSWSKSITLSGDGAHGLTATATDAAGNTGAVSAAVTYTLDTAAPSVTAKLANDTGSSSTDGITAAAGLSGTANANAAVTVKNGSTVLGTTTADAAGKWSFTPTGLADSTYTLAASQADQAGSTGTANVTFTLDTKGPAPVVTQVVRNSNGTVTLSGTSEANSKITLSDTTGFSTAAVGIATASDNGAWSVTAPINTTTINSYTAGATDLAGNNGATAGKFLVSSSGNDFLTGASGRSDVFAFLPSFGRDMISGFTTTAAAAANHDYIDLSGSNYGSFGALQPRITQGGSGAVIAVDNFNSVTLVGVTATTLQASDFRFS